MILGPIRICDDGQVSSFDPLQKVMSKVVFAFLHAHILQHELHPSPMMLPLLFCEALKELCILGLGWWALLHWLYKHAVPAIHDYCSRTYCQ